MVWQDGRLANHRAHTVPVFVHYNGMAKAPGHVPESLDAKALYRSLLDTVAPKKVRRVEAFLWHDRVKGVAGRSLNTLCSCCGAGGGRVAGFRGVGHVPGPGFPGGQIRCEGSL